MPFALLGANPVIAGILAAAILVGAVLLGEFIAHIVDAAVPIPGLGTVARALGKGINAALRAIGGLLDAVAGNVLGFVINIPDALMNGLLATFAALRGHLRLLRMIFMQAIPDLYRNIANTASSILRYLESRINQLYNQAIAYATSVRAYVLGALAAQAAALSRRIESVYATLANAINTGLASLTAYVVARFNLAMATIAGVRDMLTRLIGSVRAELAAYAYALAKWAVDTAVRTATDWARQYADYVLAAYRGALSAATAIALAPAYPRILDALDSIVQALPGSLADALARIGAIPRVVPRDVAVAAGVATAVGAISLDWVAKCGVGLCRNLDGFGRELSALGDAAMMAEIVALIMDAISDPEGAAGGVHATLTRDLTAVGNEFTSILTGV